MNNAKASKSEFTAASGASSDPAQQQARHFATFLPALPLRPIESFADWKQAMDRYVETLRVVDDTRLMATAMSRHFQNVTTVHRTTQGLSSTAEPFNGATFWQYYDCQRRMDLFNDPSNGSWFEFDHSLVASITLAFGGEQMANHVRETQQHTHKRGLAGSDPEFPSGTASKKQSQSEEVCLYFNGPQGCRFSAASCKKAHRCARCNSADHSATTHI